MSKNQVIYNQIAAFAGPAPATGMHFLNVDGTQTNVDDTGIALNLVFPLNRIIQASYGVSQPRIDIKSLGFAGTIARPNLTEADVNLSLSYYQMGLINEARLGFVFNRPSGNASNGQPIYGNSTPNPISGFLDRTYGRSIESDIGWPLTYRDSRNIFIATRQDNLDLNDTNDLIAYKSTNVNVFAFGDCFINSYKTSCSVGSLPQCSIDFTCSNVLYYNSASGKNIPAVNPKNYTIISGTNFNLPNTYQGANLPTVLLPQDITITINNSDSSQIINVPFDFNDIKIQSYNIDLSLNREPLYALGYKLPLDRRINLPVFVNLNFNVIVGDNQTGSLIDFIRNDKEYDIKIKLKYKRTAFYDGTAIMYQFLGAKFNDLKIDESIQSRRIANFSFTSEINSKKYTKGFFISGQLGVPASGVGGDILLGDDFFGEGQVFSLLTEDSNNLALVLGGNFKPIF